MDEGTGLPNQGPVLPKPRKSMADSKFFWIVFGFTFFLAFAVLVASLFSLSSPTFSSGSKSLVSPYFFVLLLIFFLPNVTASTLLISMMGLYVLFFVLMSYFTVRMGDRGIVNTPVGYYGSMVSFGILLTLVITLIEEGFGVNIGGNPIEKSLQSQPYLTYVSLIFAPFAEEIGFRVIPLGAAAVILAYLNRYRRSEIALSFIVPGLVRLRHGTGFSRLDYIMIAATSLLFGYAHVYFGVWGWGKFVTAAIVGVILAVGFLKFGIFVDIPMHWFFNGFVTYYVINSDALIFTGFSIIWLIFVGVVSIIFLLILLARAQRKSGQKNQVISQF